MVLLLRYFLFCILPLVFFSHTAGAQEAPALLVLGSAHFANPGRDAVNFEVADVMSDTRQQQMEDVVRQLAEFEPTHIAVEVLSRQQAELDQRYRDYRDGKYELNRNESEQLGMRLAALLGHERVYAVDWNENPPGPGTPEDYDWYAYGETNGHNAILAAITDPERAKDFYVEMGEQSIGKWLLRINAPANLAASHRVYFDIASVGDGENRIGATWVGSWYARNLKIYNRLVELAPTRDKRVLVIYGQGHAYLLRQFAREHGHFDLVDVDAVLKE
jgi:hypothetical protein